jgi:hypothetical protein
MPNAVRTVTPIGPYSRPKALAKLDGRRREARLMSEARAELTAHVGGAPSATQRALIEQCAQLRLRLACMDRRFAEAGTFTEHDSKTYLAWSNSYSRTLRQLGMKGAAERGPTLAEIMAAAPPSRVRTAPAAAPDAQPSPAPQPASNPPTATAEAFPA